MEKLPAKKGVDSTKSLVRKDESKRTAQQTTTRDTKRVEQEDQGDSKLQLGSGISQSTVDPQPATRLVEGLGTHRESTASPCSPTRRSVSVSDSSDTGVNL